LFSNDVFLAALIVSGFGPQVRSVRNNAERRLCPANRSQEVIVSENLLRSLTRVYGGQTPYGDWRGPLLQRSTWRGPIREQSRREAFWFFLATKRMENQLNPTDTRTCAMVARATSCARFFPFSSISFASEALRVARFLRMGPKKSMYVSKSRFFASP